MGLLARHKIGENVRGRRGRNSVGNGAEYMKECLQDYIRNYPDELQELVRQVWDEREKYGNSGCDTIGRLMEEAVEADSDVLMGIAYYHLAEYYLCQGDMDVAGVCLTSCIKYLQGTGPYEYIARAYNVLGIAARSQDDTVTAMEHYDHAMKYCEAYGLDYVKALVQCNLADSYRQTGHREEAVGLYEKAEECLCTKESVFYYSNKILCITGRMNCLTSLDRLEEALACKEKTERLVESCEDRYVPVFAVSTAFAYLMFRQGKREDALQYARKAEAALGGTVLLENYDSILNYIHLLTDMGDLDGLTRVLDVLQPQLEKMKDSDLYLQVLRMRLQHGASRMKKEELQEGLEAFFSVYDMRRDRQSESALGSLELRRKLRQIQEKQYELDLLNKKLLSSSLHDALTGLANRGYLNQYAENAFGMAYREGAALGICLADIDYFKQLNDRYGHLAGDNCLVSVARLLKRAEGENIFCARYGGDEFTIVFYNHTAEQIKEIVESIRDELEKLNIPNEDSASCPRVTLSVGGFSKAPEGVNKLWDFFSAADTALYKAKRAGKNRFVLEETFSKNIL